ncbi:MAG: hypothetical protein PHC61_05595, partial [Chitinivibrionales bacterium]|nr:hypothetical protein [Chitinivibrionales bacterium]
MIVLIRKRPLLTIRHFFAIAGILVCLPAAALLNAAVLTVATSHDNNSTFVLGDSVRLDFTVAEATATAKLILDIKDEHDSLVSHIEKNVPSNGNGVVSVYGPNARLGFYRVYSKLSTGETLAKLGSRPAGICTYCIVPDPNKRVLYPEQETFFGLQGGFNTQTNLLPFLGVRWVLGANGTDYMWSHNEPDSSGQFAARREAALKQGRKFPEHSAAVEGCTYKGNIWKVYTLPTLYQVPAWAMPAGDPKEHVSVLNPKADSAWVRYCREAVKAYSENYPDRKYHLYQITWETEYPWGFKATADDLIRIYKLAYPAIHKADPKAVVLGPTGGSMLTDWQIETFKAGLLKYLDGISEHPYCADPDRNNLLDQITALKQAAHRYGGGREFPLYGTEQGVRTDEKQDQEVSQARFVVRSNLMMLGEGWKVNISFYCADYWGEPGFGFYYNINPKIEFQTDKVCPKPIAPAFAAMSYLLEGHTSAGRIEWSGAGVLGYAFERGDDII